MGLLTALWLSAVVANAGDPSQGRGWLEYWERVPVSALPPLVPDGDLDQFKLSLERQIENCREFSSGQFLHCPGEAHPVHLECDTATLQDLLKLSTSTSSWSSFYTKAKQQFDWFRYKGTPRAAKAVQFTGYNTPLFEGALRQDSQFRYSAFSRPADLVDLKGPNGEILWKKKLPDGTLVPYDDRKAIDVDRVLAGKGLETAFFEFPSDLLRLQIEGSGVLEVRGEGGKIRQYGLSFAGKNGLPFVSVFKYLREKGVDRKYLSFPGLKAYFQDFPDDMWPTLITNPSYVFFSLTEEPPCGSARVFLTGGHSLATDPSQLPLGMVAFFAAERPVEGTDPGSPTAPSKPFTRFAVAQDTGGAIQGAHVDVYWGTSDYAQLASNLMNSKGTLFFPRHKSRSTR